ncbi:Dihydrodipicolinate reductase [Raoultella terrigena]|uniref:Dihydrodipicolinate reductase n=1 Tax=Raoultella terrigena TaxID=577 RepID=A0A4U9D7K2_RAOTE|nr:Dihydrodipicolinate reductase [Raoultella terrigena]
MARRWRRDGSSLIGSDAGELAGAGKMGVTVQSSLTAVKESFDVLIDFTRPEGTLAHLAFCREHGKGMVIGTTGFDDAGKQAIRDAAQEIAIVFAANFSVGVNVMLKLLERRRKSWATTLILKLSKRITAIKWMPRRAPPWRWARRLPVR